MKFPSKKKGPSLGPNVAQAMKDAEIAKPDERGLMPIADARALVEKATVFVRDGADALWAALLSLEDAKEFVRHASRIEWKFHPRGKENTAFVERYGDSVLEWIAGRVDSRSVLVNFPWCIGPCLMSIGTPAAFDLVWKLRGWDDTSEMVAWEVQAAREVPITELEAALKRFRAVWMKKHADVADARIEALAKAGDEAAKAILEKRSRGLSEETILELLDEKATEGLWPLFYYKADGRLEYFAMRLVVARAGKGDGWGIVFQRLAGSYPEALRVEQFAYGSGVGDPYVDAADCLQVEWEGEGFHGATVTPGDFELDEGMIDEKDLRFGRCVEIGYHPYRVAVIRAVLAHDPDAFWPKDKAALEVLGLGKGAKVLFTSTAFHHVIGPNGREGAPERPWEILPSASPVFQSLAKAIVDKDPTAFQPGESNLDWRLHALTDEPVTPPWVTPRFEPPWLGSAMKEAGVKKTDPRGCMPLEEARAIAGAAKRFERGVGSRVGKHWAQGSDRLWAAVLSLADGKELAEKGALEWTMPVRGAAENTAIAERYGSSAVGWVRTFVRAGVLEDKPGCLRATLLAMEGEEALAFLMELDGISAEGESGSPAVQLAMLLEKWLDGTGARVEPLVRRVMAGDERAKTMLRSRALIDESVASVVEKVTGSKALLDTLGVPRELSAQHVLARVDRAASGPADDMARWPRFFHNIYPGEAEYHGMRLLGVRSSVDDGWAIVIERITGYGNTGRVLRYVLGVKKELEPVPFHLEIDDETVKGPKGKVKVTDVDARAMLTEPPDYWGGREARSGVAPLRAYVDAHAGTMFTPAKELAASLGLKSPPIVIADTTAFAHVDGPEVPAETDRRPTQIRPSESVAYRSLAEAIAKRDPELFDPGEPNTDWRLHAVFSASAED